MAKSTARADAYLLTFTCYGTWLHGDARGSVARRRQGPSVAVAPDTQLEALECESRAGPARSLDEPARNVVLASIHEVCGHRHWQLLAAHVRPRHVHVVVCGGAVAPERIIGDLKAYATRALRTAGRAGRERVWSRFGSTRYLWDAEAVERAVHYVAHEQGAPMAVFVAPLGSRVPAG